MFKLSSAAPGQARNQTTIAESAHHYLEQVKQLNPQAEGAAPILSHERAAELIADADRARLERDLARSQALMQVRIDDAQRARQVGDALLSWTERKDADTVQRAPNSVEREAIAKRHAIKGAVAALEQGGIEWPDIHVSTLAQWLVETVPELAGADPGSIKRAYLQREGLAPASCSTGRCSVEIKRLELGSLDTAYRQGCAAQSAGQTVAVPIPLRAAG